MGGSQRANRSQPAGRHAPSPPDDGQTGALVNRRAFLGSLTAGLLAARARGEPFNPVNRSNRFAYFLFLSTSLAVLIPALALVFFAEPVADDFGRAVVVDVPTSCEPTTFIGRAGGRR